MKEEVNLLYSLDVPQSWNEDMNIKIDISDFSDDIQILKILSAIIPFFIKIGFSPDDILDSFSSILSQLNETEDDYIEAYEDTKDPNLTLEQFEDTLKNNKSFVKYMYNIYIEDMKI